MEPNRPGQRQSQSNARRRLRAEEEFDDSRHEAGRNPSSPHEASEARAQLQEDNTYKVSLTNGCTDDVRFALCEWGALTALLENDPKIFQAALELAHGRVQPPREMQLLRHALLTFHTGQLRPSIRNLLLASYRDTPEGPVMAFPFKLDNEEDRMAVEAAERRAAQNLRAFGAHLLGELRETERGGGWSR